MYGRGQVARRGHGRQTKTAADMSSGTILQLRDSSVEAITTDGDRVRVRFAPAMIVKSQGIPLVDASTLWIQSGELVIEEAQIEGDLPAFPAAVKTGSMEAGGVKYVGSAQLPLDTQGYAQLTLSFAGDETQVLITGAGARLNMEDIPKYVEHIADTQPKV